MTSIDVAVPLPFRKRVAGETMRTGDLGDLVIDAGLRDDGKQPLVPEFFHARPAIDRAEERLTEDEQAAPPDDGPAWDN